MLKIRACLSARMYPILSIVDGSTYCILLVQLLSGIKKLGHLSMNFNSCLAISALHLPTHHEMFPTRIACRGLTRHARRLTPLPTIAPEASTSTPLPTPSSSKPRSNIGEYLVSRSAGGELPVYSENTRGTVWKTIVRKIDVSLPMTP
jgi:hypothetical protein